LIKLESEDEEEQQEYGMVSYTQSDVAAKFETMYEEFSQEFNTLNSSPMFFSLFTIFSSLSAGFGWYCGSTYAIHQERLAISC
jgi:hypothetical protein